MSHRFFTVLIFFIFFSSFFFNASANTVINDVDFTIKDNKYSIILNLNNPYEDIPSVNFGNGWVRVDLPNISFKPEITEKKVGDFLITNIKFFQLSKDTMMQVELSDYKFDASGLFDFRKTGNKIEFFFSSKAPKPIPISETAVIENQSEVTSGFDVSSDSQKLKSKSDIPFFDKEPDSLFAGKENSMDGSFDLDEIDSGINKTIFFLAVFLALAYLLLLFVNWRKKNKFKFKEGNFDVSVISIKNLDASGKVYVLDINNQKFACGVTKNNINFLTAIPQEIEPSFISMLEDRQMTVAALRTAFLNRKKDNINSRYNASNPTKENKKPSFNQELMGKIKKMKKIN